MINVRVKFNWIEFQRCMYGARQMLLKSYAIERWQQAHEWVVAAVVDGDERIIAISETNSSQIEYGTKTLPI